jgi:hypothetical protein
MDPAASDGVDQVLIRVIVHPHHHDALVGAFALDRRPPLRRLVQLYELSPDRPDPEPGVAVFDRRRPGDMPSLTVQVRPLRPSLIPVAAGFRGDPEDRVDVFAEWTGEDHVLVARLTRPRHPAVPKHRSRVPARAVLPARPLEFVRVLAGLDLTGSRLTVRDLVELTWSVEISGRTARIRCRRRLRVSGPRDGVYEVRLLVDAREAPLVLPTITAQLALRGVQPR